MATSKGASSPASTSSGKQTIEQLQQRYEQLNKQKIQSETKLESAKHQLDELKREAREKYGTDDLDQLRTKLAAMKEENETKRASYQSELERIEGELQQVEQKFKAAENMPP